MRHLILLLLVLVGEYGWSQQTLIDKKGMAKFYSEAPLENIEAINEKVAGALNTSNGEVAVSMLMRDFEFDKSLMQQHFNENYVESDKYPKSTFKGKLSDFDSTLIEKQGMTTFEVSGDLTIHGVTKPLKTNVEINVSGDRIRVETRFMVTVESFDIDIPKVVFYNIAEEVEVTAKFEFKK